MRSSKALLAAGLACALQVSHSAPAAELFDFWLGDWTVRWTNANGTQGSARNRIQKILDGRVIEEQFEQDAAGAPPLLKGRSLTVLDGGGVWRQAWADNQGGYFNFVGGSEGETRFFATEFKQVGEQLKGQRMRFYDIRPTGFVWDWEGSDDGGKHWTLLWRLRYERTAARVSP